MLERPAQLEGNVVETGGMALRRLFFHALDGEALAQDSTDHPDVQDPIKDNVRSGTASLSVSQGEVHYNLHDHHDQSHAWCPDAGCGADLVVLALNKAAASTVESSVQRLVQATPAKASTAAATPES